MFIILSQISVTRFLIFRFVHHSIPSVSSVVHLFYPLRWIKHFSLYEILIFLPLWLNFLFYGFAV